MPTVGTCEARYDVEQRGLAGAVGPDDPEDLVLVQVEADTIDGGDSPVMLGQPICGQADRPPGGSDGPMLARVCDMPVAPRPLDVGTAGCGRGVAARRELALTGGSALEEHRAQDVGTV